LYFTYVSSVAAIRQSSTRLQASYLRGDLAPTLSAPFSPWTWLDITPTVSVRSTYWSQQQAPVTNTLDPVNVIDEGLWRNLMSAGVDIRGPKLVRIFETKPKPGKDGADPTPPRKYKNTIEPNFAYTYQQAFDRDNSVIVYDEVDHFGVNANAVTYGLSTRLIAQRPRAAAEREGKTGEKILIADPGNRQARRGREESAARADRNRQPRAVPELLVQFHPVDRRRRRQLHRVRHAGARLQRVVSLPGSDADRALQPLAEHQLQPDRPLRHPVPGDQRRERVRQLP
jgi:hypothetical protein